MDTFLNQIDKVCNICEAWSLVFTLSITLSIKPFSFITKVILLIPSYSLPLNFFGPQTPKIFITVWSVSDSNEKGKLNLSEKFFWCFILSALTPKRLYPSFIRSPYESLKLHACAVHPGVFALG